MDPPKGRQTVLNPAICFGVVMPGIDSVELLDDFSGGDTSKTVIKPIPFRLAAASFPSEEKFQAVNRLR